MTKNFALAALVLSLAATPALADHNSHFGEGTALDPTGIHNARIDTLDTAQASPFQGGGMAGDTDFTVDPRQARPDTVTVDSGRTDFGVSDLRSGTSATLASASGTRQGGSSHGGSRHGRQ